MRAPLIVVALLGMGAGQGQMSDADTIKARNAELRANPSEQGCLGKSAVTCIAS